MYSFDSRVRYSEVSRDGKLSLCSAVHYMQENIHQNLTLEQIAGYFKYLDKDFCPLDIAPFARVEV